MYERFSSASKKVMQIANQEAMRADREFIGAEHILIGVFATTEGLGAQALRNLGVEMSSLRAAIKNLELQMGMMKLPMTSFAKSAIEAAITAAREDQKQSIEPEHMLVGLIANPESPATLTLAQIGVQPDSIRSEIRRLHGAQQ